MSYKNEDNFIKKHKINVLEEYAKKYLIHFESFFVTVKASSLPLNLAVNQFDYVLLFFDVLKVSPRQSLCCLLATGQLSRPKCLTNVTNDSNASKWLKWQAAVLDYLRKVVMVVVCFLHS